MTDQPTGPVLQICVRDARGLLTTVRTDSKRFARLAPVNRVAGARRTAARMQFQWQSALSSHKQQAQIRCEEQWCV